MSALNIVTLVGNQFYYATCPMDTDIGYLIHTDLAIQFNADIKRLGWIVENNNVIVEHITDEILARHTSIDNYLLEEWRLEASREPLNIGISERLYLLDQIG